MLRNCDCCGVELTPVFSDRGRRNDDFPQYENALVVTIQGGYHMLIDEYVPPFVLCADCGKKTIADNPWMVAPETENIVKGEVGDAEKR